MKQSTSIRISKNIARHRARLGWTQGELADRLGVASLTVSRWERGEKTPWLRIDEIAAVLGTTAARLVR